MKQRGFTLIEVVIALGVFAIMASITSYMLFQSFHTDTELKSQSDRLHNLEIALTLMHRDTEQLINRPVRGDQQHLIKAFIGQERYIEFTRSGVINPGAIEQKSALKRIAYVCQAGRLIRRSWNLLDAPDRTGYHDTILLNQLQACTFSYLNQRHQSMPNWNPMITDEEDEHVRLPASFTCNITMKKWGKMSILFTVPVGLYG